MIIVTRPSPFGEELTQCLNAHGYSALHVPLFTIQPCIDPASIQTAFAKLKANDIVLFTSPQLATILADYTLPSHLRYFAVGKGTAERIQKTQKNGLDLSIQVPKQQDSEGVIALLETERIDFTNSQILLVKGKQGRDHLQITLNQKQAKITPLICYERHPIQDPFKELDFNQGQKLYFVATSCDHVRRLSELLTFDLKKAPLLVIHPKQKELALALNWMQVIVVHAYAKTQLNPPANAFCAAILAQIQSFP